ncbi:XRE family transcriptional regulator [Caulobacter sp. NIBR1757]|uniref:helix-turn-helix domain-containing protein n=1 Tax=Caulobacter sp. NIBR1757 TaxID=3016000 RepID=UPI0022F0415A|nr:XRE family transcriptional regulator [Caulobacter sp. NIBR1757]WGM39754.1 hypothetical protein AMEJIAPC_02681 [Caulobacter sp. NIBR1757]
MIDQTIGRRIRALRVASRMSQADVAQILSLNDRQSVSQIEAGQRRLKADELIKIVERFEVSLEQLTNPFLLFEKESFSWRQHHVPSDALDAYEAKAGEWIGAYRELNRLGDGRLPVIMPRLGLTHTSQFEDAVAAGEAVAAELELGSAPAHRLAEVMEQRYGILVLMVDAIQGVSGAACRLPELNAVLINRHESEARRNYDLAHEFFHILTWDTMKPERVESSEVDSAEQPRTQSGKRNQRIERLADNFASGLLMPGDALEKLGEPQGDLDVWLAAAAAELGVSGLALKWRLVNSRRYPAAAKVQNDVLTRTARDRGPEEPPPLFSGPFVRTIVAAIEAGHLSSRRAASLLDMTAEDLGDLCETFGIDRPAEL